MGDSWYLLGKVLDLLGWPPRPIANQLVPCAWPLRRTCTSGPPQTPAPVSSNAGPVRNHLHEVPNSSTHPQGLGLCGDSAQDTLN